MEDLGHEYVMIDDGIQMSKTGKQNYDTERN